VQAVTSTGKEGSCSRLHRASSAQWKATACVALDQSSNFPQVNLDERLARYPEWKEKLGYTVRVCSYFHVAKGL